MLPKTGPVLTHSMCTGEEGTLLLACIGILAFHPARDHQGVLSLRWPLTDPTHISSSLWERP